MFNTQRIGDVAGVVWQKLREKEDSGCTLTQLKKIPGYTSDEVLAGIGWLAREGKITVENQGRKTIFSLVEPELQV